MVFVLLLSSVVVPAVLWLIFGAADLRNTANLFFFAIVVLHLYALIWQRHLFRLFGGDRFTYVAVGLGINLLSLVYTVVLAFIFFHMDGIFSFIFGTERYAGILSVPMWLLGFGLAGLLVTVAVPILTTRHVNPLPSKSDRREYATPDREES